MGRIVNIIDGTIKNILNKEVDLYQERLAVCKECPLYFKKGKLAAVCNPRLYMNPDTKETSTTFKPGYKSGCGCVLSSKLRVRGEKCPLKQWI